MKIIKVEVEKYQAEDGSVFDTKEEAIHCDKINDGSRKVCPACKGTKEVDPYGDGKEFHRCNICDGKGYVEKKEAWE